MNRRTIFLYWLCLVGWRSLPAQAIIPRPVEIQKTGDTFYVEAATGIYCSDSLLIPAAELLQQYTAAAGGQAGSIVTTQPAGSFISLQLDSTLVIRNEGYTLHITSRYLQLTGHDAAGVVHGIQTLRQLWQSPGQGVAQRRLAVPGYVINDFPRFGYRGMALDVSRHFFPVSFVKKYIDLLSLYKFNTFHWHLTDDQGWRIEIKQYPRLQSVAAWRQQTLTGHKKETPHRFDGKRYGGYYSQEEVKEIVRYAAQRGITIIPEIEMPGHALAALAAYPSLGCTGGPYATATFWGVFDDVFCAGNDSAFQFLQDVLDEVMVLFPSRYIHIGGDECPKTRWKACGKCQQRRKTLSLPDEHALQSWFVQRMEKYLNSHGRSIIGWDEILEGGLAPNATVMSWRGEEGGLTAARQQHALIMTPESHLYFDYYQSRNMGEPVAAGHYTPLSKVYSYQPAVSLPDSLQQYMAGVEGQAWSEYYTDTMQAAYMIFPRALALAELGWTPVPLRQYDHFLQRLRQQSSLLQRLQVPVSRQYDEVVCTGIQARPGSITLSLHSAYPGAQIHYTTGHTPPTRQSPVYTTPVVMKKSGLLQAQAFDESGQPLGRVYQQSVTLHKAAGAAVAFTQAPLPRWDPGAGALVNGIVGAHRYNDAQWLGFGGDDLEAVIDLGHSQTIRSVGMNLLHYPWQRIWAPVALAIAVSEDGTQYKTVHTQKDFPVNGINPVRASFPAVKGRYIRVAGVNKGILPEGAYGAGSKALLMIDEVVVE